MPSLPQPIEGDGWPQTQQPIDKHQAREEDLFDDSCLADHSSQTHLLGLNLASIPIHPLSTV
jgi:hypothetical protein